MILERTSKELQCFKEWQLSILELIRIKERKFGGLFTDPISKPVTLYEWKKHDADLYKIKK